MLVDTTAYNLSVGQTLRTTCPACHENTFTITRNVSGYVYNCYRMSCSLRGGVHERPSIQDIPHILTERGHKGVTKEYQLPPYLIKGIASEDALKWIIDNNMYEAYTNGYVDIYTDLKEERICIPLHNMDDVCVNMTGRSWSGGKPKSRIYNRGGEVPPLLVGRGTTLVIVEDAASACSVSNLPIYTGMALLGTNFNYEYHLSYVRGYDKYIVALDYDASRKAMEIEHNLQYFVDDVRTVLLTRDLKEMTTTEIELGLKEK